MADAGLSAYKFTVSRRYENKLYDLHKFKSGLDIIDCLKERFDRTKIVQDRKEEKKTLEIESYEVNDVIIDGRNYYKYLLMEVNTGEYGVNSTFKDRKTMETIFERTTDMTECVSLYAFLAIRYGAKEDKGILLLETVSRFGVKTILTPILSDYCKRIDDNALLNISSISTTEEINRLLDNNTIKKMKLIKTYKSLDKSSKRISQKVEKIFHYPRIDTNIIKNVFKNKSIKGTGYTEIEEFDADDFGVCFSVGEKNNKEKTFRIKNMQNICIDQDISENVTFENNFPTKESLLGVMKERAEELFKLL